MQNNNYQQQIFPQNKFPPQFAPNNNQQMPQAQNYFNQPPQSLNQQQNKQPMNFPPQPNIPQQLPQQPNQNNPSQRVISISQRNLPMPNENRSIRNILPQTPTERNNSSIRNPPSIRNNPPGYYNNQPNQILREAPKSVRNPENLSPQGPLSAKTNKSWSAQKPAFVEYYPPVYVPHIEPMITQTLVDNPIQVVDLNKFEEMWNKRMQGIEDLLKIQPEQVCETIELRASGQDDSEQVTELQNELFRVKMLLESREKEIMELKIQLQNTIEQLDFESAQSKNMAELQLKISSLQQTIISLQYDLKSSSQTIDEQKALIQQFRAESLQYQKLCRDKDAIIEQLRLQIEDLNQKIQVLSEEITTTTSYRTFEEEANLWRRKFQELNDTYHACQENLIVKEAEYELLFKTKSNLQLQLNQKDQEIEQLKQQFRFQLDQKDQEIEQLKQQIEELYQQNDQLNEEIVTTQSVRTYEEEANMWKKKFKELNDTYHACQEKLMVKEAEYESLLKSQSSQQKIVTSTTVYKQGSRSVKNESDYLSSSMTQNDIEKLQTQSKQLVM